MQQIQSTHAEDRSKLTDNGDDPVPARRQAVGHLRRFWLLYVLLALVVGLAILPPLINVNRFQRRIATSISGSLGRPVHLDRVALIVLPLPGFELQNLVVDEDPVFGAEPIIRANTVRATLRLSSLWRGRVEFSTISFTEPSLNLVRAANGKWNFERVLLQASHIDAAPTAQRKAGPTPRFPYIEATGARINFKQDEEKTPFSLVESEFALWSPDPNQWRIRLKAKPARTDSSASDTGTIEMEGTLGRGDTLAHIPVNLEGQWRDAPLGEASRVLTGSDAGWRGNMVLSANIRGTLGESAVSTRLRLMGARRSDFIPQQPLSADANCFATAMGLFHDFEDLRCSWPPDGGTDSPIVALTGSVPDILRPESANVQLGTSGIPAATALSWLRVMVPGISDDISVAGKFSASFSYDGGNKKQWAGQMALREAGLKTAAMEAGSLVSGDVQLQLTPAAGAGPPVNSFTLTPVALMLGGHDPATLDGRFDRDGYSVHLAGMATEERMKQLAAAIAPLGAGLPGTEASADATADAAKPANTAPNRVDVTSSGSWGAAHTWQASQPVPKPKPKRGR